MTVICDNCQAENRDKAMFCRGCAGKLPAFMATAPAPLTMPAGRSGPDAARGSPGTAGRPSSRGGTAAGRDRRVRRGWFAAILLLGAAAAALVGWIALTPERTVAAVTASAASATETASAAASAAVPTPMPASNQVPFESALAPGESAIAASPAPSSAVDPTVDAMPPAASVPAPTTRAATTARAHGQRNAGGGRADPRAGCEHLFFAFAARCEANHCAEAAYARHPRCDIVRAERQRDDARRNMTSGY